MYQRKDSFYRRAKQSGQRSRAAYKLEELSARYHLFKPGQKVLDIGAWPGGWLQVAAQQVGPRGLVLGVDLQPIAPLPTTFSNVTTVVGDITSPATIEKITLWAAGGVDVVLSDIAPKLTGIRDRDVAVAQALVDSVLDLTLNLLRSGGTLIVKLFMSDAVAAYVERLRSCFRHVCTTRPQATRKGSSELYAVATGFRGRGTVSTSRAGTPSTL